MPNSQYTKISKISLESNKNLSLDSPILNDILNTKNLSTSSKEINLNTKNLSTSLEEVNLATFAYYNFHLSKLPSETFKVKVNTTNEDNTNKDNTNKDKLYINFTLNVSPTKILIEQNNNIPILRDIENSWTESYPINLENIKDNFNYSEILFSTYQDNGTSLDANIPLITSLKINDQNLMGIDVNLKALSDLEILDTNLYTLTLGQFDALKRIRIGGNYCSGGLYIGKLASEIREINLGEEQNSFNYIVIEGNNTLLTQSNCNITQGRPTTINFINCNVSDTLLNKLIRSGNKVIIN